MSNETIPPSVNSSAAPPNRNWIPVLAGLVFFLFGLGAGYLIWGRDSAAAAAATPDPQQAGVTLPEKVIRYAVTVDDDPTLGPEDAPITLIEFSDYQCPFCTKWHDEVFFRLQEEYGDKIRFVYRDLPLPFHPEAQSAAEAANCAWEQGDYWEFHNALFSDKYGLGVKAYQQYAADLGLDADALTGCLLDGRYADEVQADYDFAGNLGVSSTPTFFINGIALVGAQPYEVFKQVIDLELAGKIPE
jgi:protein-disulfide isomerase